MKVCIASVHAKCSKQSLWRELQRQFIAECASWDFEYYVIANGLDPTEFKGATGVTHFQDKSSHVTCLKEALAAMRASSADYLLLLDSDCWPVRVGWEQLLVEWLSKGYQLAAPVRTENLDSFPHPCAVFLPASSLINLRVGFGRSVNFLGDPVVDVCAAIRPTGRCYPLLKTNYWSPHPLYASIYNDVFYHHGAGSRGIVVRCDKYYRHVVSTSQQRKIYVKVTQQLQQSPRKLMDMLRGVDNERVEDKLYKKLFDGLLRR